MRRLSLVLMLVCGTGLLAACQTGKPVAGSAAEDGVTPNAVAGDAIKVTALDAAPEPAAGAATASASAAPPKDATNPAVTDAVAEDAAIPEADPATAKPEPAAAEPALKPDLTETPVPPKSDVQLACEKKGSKWFKIGDGEKFGCVRETKDSGKRCERESQCDGVCLARSRTCSPFKPLYGCNEILQDDGARVTLCLD